MNGSGISIDADEASWQKEKALELQSKVWDVQRHTLEARIEELEEQLEKVLRKTHKLAGDIREMLGADLPN